MEPRLSPDAGRPPTPAGASAPARPDVRADLRAQLLRLGLLEVPADAGTAPGLVEGLGRWLRWTDAIPLAAALQPATGQRPQPLDAAAWAAEVARVRASLERAIRSATAASLTETDVASWRRRHAGVQQTMETALAALRGQLRAALAHASPAQARLAALDAVFGDALAHRETALLALLPGKLERHLERLQGARDSAAPPNPPTPPAPAPAGEPRQPAWLAPFRQDLQQLLQAELELRLQPALGLLAAMHDTDPASA